MEGQNAESLLSTPARRWAKNQQKRSGTFLTSGKQKKVGKEGGGGQAPASRALKRKIYEKRREYNSIQEGHRAQTPKDEIRTRR